MSARSIKNERFDEIRSLWQFIKDLESSQDYPIGGIDYLNKYNYNMHRILCSSLLLMLYNVIEATISLCIRNFNDAIKSDNICPYDLRDEIFAMWWKDVLKKFSINNTDDIRSFYESLDSKNDNTDYSIALTVYELKEYQSRLGISLSSGGNLDHNEILRIFKKLGMDLEVSENVYRNALSSLKEDNDDLSHIKQIRNSLAHGSLSFSDKSLEQKFERIDDYIDNIDVYLNEVLDFFEKYMFEQQYLRNGRIRV